MSIQMVQIRKMARFPVIMGAAPVVLNPFMFKLEQPTRAIIVAFENVVNNVPNDPLLPAILLNYQLQLNSNIVVPNINGVQFNAVIQNTEKYQPQTISNGLIFQKAFMPPIMKDTQVILNISINTLALGTTTPAAACTFDLVVYTIDRKADDPLPSNKCTYLKALPRTANIAANVPQDIAIATDPRTLLDFILIEQAAAVNVDLCLGLVSLVADSVMIQELGTAIMKEMYRSQANQAVPAGHYMFKVLTPLEPSNYKNVFLRFQMHTAGATEGLAGWERFLKAYV